MPSTIQESKMLCCFLLVKADRVLNYCKKSLAEPVFYCIKTENWTFLKKKKLMTTHARIHTQAHIQIYCSQVSLHFQPCKTKLLLAHLGVGIMLNNGNTKLCVVLVVTYICVSLITIGKEIMSECFKITFYNVFYFVSPNIKG